MRRRPREVSSLYLWRLASQALAADERRHRLIKSLLLLTQLLIVSLLALALAGPRISGGPEPVRLAIVVDTSASMGAGADRPAAEMAARAIERFLSQGEASRYLLWSTTGTLLRYDGDSKDELLDELQLLPPPGASSDWEALTGELTARLEDGIPTLLLLVTDGAVDAARVAPLANLSPGVVLHVMEVGAPADNVAITGFWARASGRGARHHQVLVEVENFGTGRVQTRLAVAAAPAPGGEPGIPAQVVFATPLVLEPRSGQRFLLEHSFGMGEILQASIEAVDALSLDNAAYLVSGLDEPLRLLLVGEENRFLTEGFAAFPRVSLAHTFDPRLAVEASGGYDLAVFYGAQPPAEFRGDALVFAQEDGDGGVFAEITWWDRRHPLSRFVDWESVSVGRVVPLIPGPGEQVLLQSTAGPLLTVTEQAGRRVIRVSLSLDQSDFPFRVAFPIFLQNVLEWMKPEGQERVPPAGAPGRLPDALATLVAAGEPVLIIDPAGQNVAVPAAAGPVTADDVYRSLIVPGVYTWQAGGRTGRFALSLLDREESDTSRRLGASLEELGAVLVDPNVDTLATMAELIPASASDAGEPARREGPWRWMALAVILLLLLEGRLYRSRRVSQPQDPGLLAGGRTKAGRRRHPRTHGGVNA